MAVKRRLVARAPRFRSAPLVRRLQGKRIAVLKGGWSKERAVSLRTGAAVEEALRRVGLRPLSLDAGRDIAQVLARKRPDICFLALHGTGGEDGRLQGLLDVLGIPYTGSGVLASAVAMDKHVSKQLFRFAGVPTADWVTLTRDAFDRDPKSALTPATALVETGPVFVKPADQGSAIGVSKADDAAALEKSVRTAFKFSSAVMIERFVAGRELTVGILGHDALPVVEIVPKHAFYDYFSKYAAGGSEHLVPAPLDGETTRRVQDAALRAFRALGCTVYGRVDVLLEEGGALNLLEVNTIPGMTATSLLPDAARAAGISFEDLVLRIIESSLQEKRG